MKLAAYGKLTKIIFNSIPFHCQTTSVIGTKQSLQPETLGFPQVIFKRSFNYVKKPA